MDNVCWGEKGGKHFGHVSYSRKGTFLTCLSVSIDDGSQQLPRASSPVHSHHPEYLEESEAAEGGGREHLAVGAAQHDDRGTYGYHIYIGKKKGENLKKNI